VRAPNLTDTRGTGIRKLLQEVVVLFRVITVRAPNLTDPRGTRIRRC
jgi:hypothetical protein